MGGVDSLCAVWSGFRPAIIQAPTPAAASSSTTAAVTSGILEPDLRALREPGADPRQHDAFQILHAAGNGCRGNCRHRVGNDGLRNDRHRPGDAGWLRSDSSAATRSFEVGYLPAGRLAIIRPKTWSKPGGMSGRVAESSGIAAD